MTLHSFQQHSGELRAYVTLKDDSGCSVPEAVGLEMKLNFAALPDANDVSNPAPAACMKTPFAPGCPPPYDAGVLDFPQGTEGGNASFNPFGW